MKTFAFTLAATALSASIASAGGIETYDRNGDRFATLAEVQAVNPRVSVNDFRDLDVNRDRRLSAVEILRPGTSAILNRGTGGTPVYSTFDISGGPFVTEDQLSSRYPGLSPIDFGLIDTNNDNRVGAVELYAADAQARLGRYEAGFSDLVTLDKVDSDGSNFASFRELAAQYPRLSRTDFRLIDTNNDNRISFDELYELDAIQILGTKT